MNSSKHSSTSLGVTSLITFFTILVLVSFSLLVTSTARNDAQLSDRASASVTEYYAADVIAEEKLMQLHTLLISTQSEDLASVLSENSFNVVQDDDYNGMVIEYTISINDKKDLKVKIGFNVNQPEIIERLSWQTIII